jgi:serine/threonine protein kinase
VETTGTKDAQAGLIGQVVAGLKIRQLLRSGGMGQVYLADQIALGTTRVIKVIDSDYRHDERVVSRFRREAKVLSRLHHNHIIQVLDFGEFDDGTLFLSMEYIDGGDLETYLDIHGSMDFVSGLCILKDIADAVRYAHGEQVLHRDLKPGNIVLRADDASQAKIIDFGLVTLLGAERATKLTEDNMVVGSPLFMSPEQIQGVPDLTGAVDVYALAGLAYALFTGDSVFRSEDHESLLSMVRAHCYDEPVRLSDRNPHCTIPKFLDTLLLACLAKNPEHRPSAEEVSFHFARLHNEASQTSPPRPSSRLATATLDESQLEMPGAFAQVATAIWSETIEPQTPSRSRLDALGKQIEEVLLEIGEAAAGSNDQAQAHTDPIRQVIESLSTLELEQALLASDAGDQEGSLQADLLRQRILMGSRINELQTVLRQQYREFYVFVKSDTRDRDSDEDYLFELLDQLVETFMQAGKH